MIVESIDSVYFLITPKNYTLKDSNDIQNNFDVSFIKEFLKKDEKEIDNAKLLYSKVMNKHLFGIITENDIKELESFILENKKIYNYQREFFLKIIREANCENR